MDQFVTNLLCVFLVSSAPPTLYITPQQLTIRIGDLLQIQCVAQGSQPITIEWSKMDGQLSTAASDRHGVLRIQPITAADAGRYRCMASNEAGRSELYAEVTVVGQYAILL